MFFHLLFDLCLYHQINTNNRKIFWSLNTQDKRLWLSRTNMTREKETFVLFDIYPSVYKRDVHRSGKLSVVAPRWFLENFFEFYSCNCFGLELLMLIEKICRVSVLHLRTLNLCLNSCIFALFSRKICRHEQHLWYTNRKWFKNCSCCS